MSYVAVYADAQSVLKEIEDEDLIIEIKQRLVESSNFKRIFCGSEDIQKALDDC